MSFVTRVWKDVQSGGNYGVFLLGVGLKTSRELMASVCAYPLLSLSAGAAVNITRLLHGDAAKRNGVTVGSGWLRNA